MSSATLHFSSQVEGFRERMGEITSLWGYSEQQLRQKLLYTTLELDKLKVEKADEARTNKEYVDQLIDLIKCVIQERDEARSHIQTLTATTINNDDFFPATIPPFGAIDDDGFLNPMVKAANHSSITESGSLSETLNYHSPVDSIFDAVSSAPEFTNMTFANHNPQYYVQDSSSAAQFGMAAMPMPTLDRGSLIIEELSKGKVLPKKGRLLEAVSDAGPLLHTLMVAGPLPRWRNPPQMQRFQIPPVAINGGGLEVLAQNPASSTVGQLGSMRYMSDFGNVEANCVNNASLMPSAVSSNGWKWQRTD